MTTTWDQRFDPLIDVLRRLVEEVQGSTRGVESAELLADVRGLNLVISAASALQAVRLAQFASRDEMRDEHGVFVEVDLGLGNVGEFRADDAAPVLAMSPGMAQRRVSTAARLASVLPQSLRALADGALDPFRVQIIAEETLLADRATCAAVEERLFPLPPEMTPGALRRRVRRILVAVAPEAVAQQAIRARQRLFVHVRTCEVPGVSEWFAHLNAEDSVLCWAAIDEAAHQSKAHDPTRCIDQCRAEALADLILDRAEVSAQVLIPIPVCRDASVAPAALGGPAALTAAEGPYTRDGDAFFRHASGVEVGGVGVIHGEVLERLLDRFETTITGMFVDGQSGVTLGMTSPLYRPPARMKELVRLRDGTCRFPGCAVAARRCDLDHVVPWSSTPWSSATHSSAPPPAGTPPAWGRTEPDNLMCLCRRHHRLKTQARWTPVLHPATAEVTWTDPYGQRWLTRPMDHREPDVA
ncbi:MAG: DUF222 domain-containing protein [Ornithinimicrobium sp.]